MRTDVDFMHGSAHRSSTNTVTLSAPKMYSMEKNKGAKKEGGKKKRKKKSVLRICTLDVGILAVIYGRCLVAPGNAPCATLCRNNSCGVPKHCA